MSDPNLIGQLFARIAELELEMTALKNGGLFLAKGIDDRQTAQAGLANIVAGQQLITTVLFRLLDGRGAVPAQEVITALEGVRAILSDEDKKGPKAAAIDFQIEALKSLDTGRHKTRVRH